MTDVPFRQVEEYAAAERVYADCKRRSQEALHRLDEATRRLQDLEQQLKRRVGNNIPRKYFILSDKRILVIDQQTGVHVVEPEHE